jgi:FkbH-like protein
LEAGPADLPWLVEPSQDFRLRVRALRDPSPESRAQAQQLARLDGNRLHSLGQAIARLVAANPSGATRLGVLSNGTTDLLLPAIGASALRHGVWLEVIGTAFDQVATEALDPSSAINRTQCHLVLLAVDHRGLPLVATPGDHTGAQANLESAFAYIDSIRAGLRAGSGCTVILQTVPQVPAALFGNLERTVPGTMQWLIDRYNQGLRERAASSADLLLDTAALAETVGLARWHDPVQWTLGKFLFAHELVPLYCDWVGRLIGAARGKSRKCLVLDLDNTLWGGVIGDDGLAGIVLGNGNPAGEAHLSVQQAALGLRERGVILAVSSKNDDAVARSAFREHPEMLLKEDHIAVFQANWQDKASNLKAIAETLNIGIDSLVLLDDNPAERAQVRAALPEVAVPELPADPAFFAGTLLSAGYFEAIGFTAEDRQRAEQYQANAARTAALGTATDLQLHLQSLQMKAICTPFDEIGRARITQLINKTNQFNLTTRRYTEADVKSFEQSPAGLTLQIRLVDRFGDNGMISVVICRPEGPDWWIDTWLMSCRVLNRRVERTTLNQIVAAAKAGGVRALIGEYLKTERNGMVEDHYERLGFERVEVGAERSLWRLDVNSYVAEPVPIEVITASEAANERRALA